MSERAGYREELNVLYTDTRELRILDAVNKLNQSPLRGMLALFVQISARYVKEEMQEASVPSLALDAASVSTRAHDMLRGTDNYEGLLALSGYKGMLDAAARADRHITVAEGQLNIFADAVNAAFEAGNAVQASIDAAVDELHQSQGDHGIAERGLLNYINATS